MTAPIKHDSNAEIKIVTTRSHMTGLIQKSLQSIPNSKMIHAGGAGYKVISVIDGEADCYIYPRNGTKRWDTCAPEAIIRSLGGCLTDVFNKEYLYLHDENHFVENYTGIVTSLHPTNEFFTDKLSNELKEHVKKDAEAFVEARKPKL